MLATLPPVTVSCPVARVRSLPLAVGIPRRLAGAVPRPLQGAKDAGHLPHGATRRGGRTVQRVRTRPR
jgi:hypothetical protein